METTQNPNQNPSENHPSDDEKTTETTQEQTAPEQNNPAPEKDAPAPVAEGQENQQGKTNDIEENKAITYLSYLGLLFLVPMLVKKDSPFAQFHAKQGLVLTIAWFIGSFLYPLFGLGVLVHIALLVLSIMGLINVSKGEMKDLPIVGDFAKKFNI